MTEQEYVEFLRENYKDSDWIWELIHSIESAHNHFSILGSMFSPPEPPSATAFGSGNKKLAAYGTIYYLEGDNLRKFWLGLTHLDLKQLKIVADYYEGRHRTPPENCLYGLMKHYIEKEGDVFS